MTSHPASSKLLRWLLTGAVGVGLLAGMAPSAFAQKAGAQKSVWAANEDDALLLDVRVGQYRLGDGVRGYQTDQGVCVDLADFIMAADIPVRLDKKSRRATGWLFSEPEKLVIDREQNTVQTMNGTKNLSPGEIFDTPEGWCADSKSLADWLNIKVTADLSNAVLLLSSDRKLPFEQAAERKARAASIRPQTSFDLASLPQAKNPYKFWQTPSVDAVVTLGGFNDKQRGGRVDASYELFASGELGKASFDARLSSDNKGVPDSLRVRAYRNDPNGRLLGPLGATQVALGDVSTIITPLGGQSIAGRGGYISNRPIERPENFDRTSFRGDLPVGWDAELYRNGQLLAFAPNRSDGRYEFLDVPLLYGQNEFEIILYGPQGQIRRENSVIPVGLDSIPPRKTFYWAGVAEAGRDLVNLGPRTYFEQAGWRGGVGVERGLDARTSIAAAAYSLVYRNRRSNYLEGSVRRAIGPTLAEFTAALDARGGYALRGQVLGQLKKTYFRLESIWGRNDYQSDRLEQNTNGIHQLTINHFFKWGERTVPVEIDARYRTRSTGDDSLEVAARISANFRNISLTSEVQWERSIRRGGPDAPDRVTTALLANLRVGKVRLRGEGRYRLSPDPRFQSATLVAETRLNERSDLRAELGYDVDSDRARLGLGYIRQFKKFAVNASAEIASDGSVAAGLNLAFSLGPDPRNGQLRFSNEKLASNGQALALVYRDINSDGIRQAEEPLEKGVELTAGRTVALSPTDGNGRAVIDGLQPFQPVLIGIDASTLPDPYVQPASSGVVVTPRPGIATRIELALVSAGEVEGNLLSPAGTDLGGVDLELIDLEGRVAKATRSEFDGYFLFEGVPYGQYRLRVGKLAAEVVRVRTELSDSIRINAKAPFARLGIIRTVSSQVQVAQAAGGE